MPRISRTRTFDPGEPSDATEIYQGEQTELEVVIQDGTGDSASRIDLTGYEIKFIAEFGTGNVSIDNATNKLTIETLTEHETKVPVQLTTLTANQDLANGLTYCQIPHDLWTEEIGTDTDVIDVPIVTVYVLKEQSENNNLQKREIDLFYLVVRRAKVAAG